MLFIFFKLGIFDHVYLLRDHLYASYKCSFRAVCRYNTGYLLEIVFIIII
jgi:hypothetical protein